MPGNIKKTLEIETKPKGFAKLRDEAGRLNKAFKEGSETYTKGWKQAEGVTNKFRKSMEGAYKALAESRAARQGVGSVGKEIESLEKKILKLENAMKRADAASGAFFQGLAQGAGVGEFLQRGPGMRRQIAGRMVGRFARAPGAMIAGGMMRGAPGLLGAIQAIPGGGVIAGPVGAAMGFAGQALQFQRQRLRAAPVLGGFGLAQQIQGAVQGTAQFTPGQISESAERARTEFVESTTKFERRKIEQLKRGPTLPGVTDPQRYFEKREASVAETNRKSGEDAFRLRKETLEGQNRAARSAAGRDIQNRFFGPIRQAGRNLAGMNRQQAEQFAAQLGTAGGTTDPRGMFGAAVAAQTVFGVGADVSGAFLRAERRGGVVGGPAGAAGLTQTLADATKLGLEGSEIVDYMRETAEGIRSFAQTGIPLNPRSVAGMAQAMSTMGLQAPRARRVAQGLFSAGQRIAQTGPTSGLDLLMLQQAGYRGGGMQNLYDAMLQLEEGGIGGPGAQELIRTLAKSGGGGVTGQFAVQRGYKRLTGQTIGLRETQILSKQALGQKLSPEESKRLKTMQDQQKAAAQAPSTPQDLQKLARVMTTKFGPNLEKQAKIQDEQLKQGALMLPAIQKLEESSTAMATAVIDILGPSIADLATIVSDAATKLSDFLQHFQENGASETPKFRSP